MRSLFLLLLLCVPASAQEFVLQPGNSQAAIPLGQRGSTRITEKELLKSQGLTIRLRPEWIWINGKWDWKIADSNVALCRKLNKAYSILLMGGGPDPLKASNRAWYISAIRALGERYGSDPLCYAYHVTGGSPPGHSEELFWRPMSPVCLAFNKELISESAKAFQDQYILLAGAATDPTSMRALVKHGVEVAPERFVYKINSLSAKTDLDWTGKRWKGIVLMADAAKEGAGIGFEMLDVSSAYRFGGTWPQAMVKKAAIEQWTKKKTIYLARYRGDL